MNKKIACFVDASGGMPTEYTSDFFNSLKNNSEKKLEADVYWFDTEVDVNSHTVWEVGTPEPQSKHKGSRCGGTDFDCIPKFCKQNPGHNTVIILTDGFAPRPRPENDTFLVNKVETYWVITPGGYMCENHSSEYNLGEPISLGE